MTNENSLAPIKPFVTEEGIELYASQTECGMSQSGLARMCGVPEVRIRETLDSIARGSSTNKRLQRLIGKDLTLAVDAANNAKVVKAKVCAAIIRYYAYDAKSPSETAEFSLEKFEEMGIDSWIRKSTGYEQSALTPEQMTLLLLETTQRALESESKLRITTEQLLDKERYITKATINAPGLFNILETAQEVDGCVVIEENKQYWTLIEWVEQYKEITIPEKMYRQLRLKVAGLFESLRHRTPKKESRLNPNGKTVPAYVYSKEDFHYLETVLTQVIGAYVP